ncbi:MAG: metalloregulator ArsR/SmtB family transcription factor [Rhodothermales bacterium]|nr:metalloregulator ArsR/SmtB family transcription factor [Rhodothermales bacterium]
MFSAKTDLFDSELATLAEQAKALSHPARLAILRVLADRESCICGDIVDDLPLAQASVSRHLKTLKNAGLIKGEIDGPRVCYCIDWDATTKLRRRMASFLREVSDPQPGVAECC